MALPILQGAAAEHGVALMASTLVQPCLDAGKLVRPFWCEATSVWRLLRVVEKVDRRLRGKPGFNISVIWPTLGKVNALSHPPPFCENWPFPDSHPIMIQGQYRYSILQVPPEVTPLKLRGYLRQEIAAVQATAVGEGDIILVRLFVLEKVLFGLGAKKVDSLLQGLVGRSPNIERIELEALSRPLSASEMQEAADEAQQTLEALGAQVMAAPGSP